MRLRLSIFVVAATAAMLDSSAAPTLARPTPAPTSAPAVGRCCWGGTHLGAALRGSSAYPNARGHADYDTGMMGRRHFGMDLWNLGGLAGKTLTVAAGGHNLATVRVGSGGRCHFGRSGSGVPRLSSGTVVRVRTSGGKLVASGTLHRRHR